MTLLNQAELAKKSSFNMLKLDTVTRNRALVSMAEALLSNIQFILQENEKDMEAAKTKGVKGAFLDRLLLTKPRIEGMAGGLRQVAALPDPLGSEDYVVKRPNGLAIGKKRVPLGVIGIIYEARPNVTSDAIGLCIKTGNAVILRGGSEAINSNSAVSDIIAKAGYEAGLPEGCIQFIKDTSRETATKLMGLNGYVDVLIPRGGEHLIKTVVQNATVPVIETGLGNCHIYVHNSADIDMAASIIDNAKTSRPAVCNAVETVLIDELIMNKAFKILHPIIEKNVELCGCEKTRKILPDIKAATEEDWGKEYDDLKLAVGIVSGIDEAIEHINRYGTKHSECIITNDYIAAETFLNEVDAAAVYVNASTRFTDGEEFGFGAEIGISTQKLHARGPLGLNELTSIKYIVRGNGQIR